MNTRYFSLVLGIVFLLIGIAGFVPGFLHSPEHTGDVEVTQSFGRLMGLFPVNALHSAVHVAIGIWGLVAWQADHIGHRVRSPRLFARTIALLYGALALLGLFPGLNTLFGVLPIHGHDVWLHAGTALIAAYFGWRPKTEVERRTAPVADRREQVEPVVHDRRRGHGDRRIPTSEV